MFNIFINDLPSIPLNSKLESYVDDSKLILSFRVGNLEDVLLAINKDLSTISTYLCTNSLLANPDKTKIMFFGSPQMLKHIPPETSFTFLGKTIRPVQNVKDLGLTMDPTLSFDEHIKQVYEETASN